MHLPITADVTRRRVMAVLAGMSGIVAGFPAVAADCGPKTFGDFVVRPFPLVVNIRHRLQYGYISLDVFLKQDGEALFSLVLHRLDQVDDGEIFDAELRFDDGVHLVVALNKLLSTPDPGKTEHVMNASVSPRGQLFTAFRKAKTVTITLVRRRTGQPVAIARDVALKGSNKAAAHASLILGECAGAARPANKPDSRPPPGSPCFLTTACAGMLGLGDDCFELRTLRRFRDGPLTAAADGPALIRAYYELAPRILAALPEAGRDRILRAIYGRYILPSVLCARFGFDRMALRIYVRAMRCLLRRYGPSMMV